MRRLLTCAALLFSVAFFLLLFPASPVNADGGVVLMGGVKTSEGLTPFKPNEPITVSSTIAVDLIVTLYNTGTPRSVFLISVYGNKDWAVEVTGAVGSHLQFNSMESNWGLWCLMGQFDSAGEPVEMTIRTTTPPPSPGRPWQLYVSAKGIDESNWQTRAIVIQNRYWGSYLPIVR